MRGNRPESASGRKRRGWPWIVVGIVVGVFKAAAYRSVVPEIIHHPQIGAAVVAGLAILALLRAQPKAMSHLLAISAGALIIRSSFLLGLGTMIGGYFALMTVCVGIGTLVKLGYEHRSGRGQRLLADRSGRGRRSLVR